MDIAGAEKKLRQAEFFLGHLQSASEDHRHQENIEPLEFYYSACLSAAQSVFYVLHDTGGAAFTEAEKRWRNGLKDDAERAKFNGMVKRRGEDVHLATTDAQVLPKYVPMDHERHGVHFFYNAAIYGEAPVIEERNPDGKIVRARAMRGAVGLYVRQGEGYVEATTACREFIEQLRSLVEAMKAAQAASQ